MTQDHKLALTRTSRIVKASPEQLYRAFMDPAELIAWLPAAWMTGEIHAFGPRVGGGYQISLYYPPDERVFRGKTCDKEDRVNVTFVGLVPERRIVETVTFNSADPAFLGEMRIVVTFEPTARTHHQHRCRWYRRPRGGCRGGHPVAGLRDRYADEFRRARSVHRT